MRHKQRPIKSSRHKSVTALNYNPHTTFKHYVGHMSDVVRLAFLENNDISPETWKNVDYNSPSSADILKHHIQQQLQVDQANGRAPPAQAQQPQTQPANDRAPGQQHDDCDESINDIDYSYDGDHSLSDSNIFATEMPTTSFAQEDSHDQTAKAPSESDFKQNQNDSGGFPCDDCGKVFPTLRKLRHHKVVHSNEFPFTCQFKGCDKRFKRKFGIDLHSTTHFDLDPEMYTKTSNNSSLPFFGRRMQYSMCKPCNQKFKTVHEYQYHMLKHGKEPFKCPVKGCGQAFSIWKSFQKHRASHYFNYYCKLDPRCDHSTSNLQLLKLHIYCCHFQRKLPANAQLSGKDSPQEMPSRKAKIEIDEDQEFDDAGHQEEEPNSPECEVERQASVSRRDPRLRRNPPRSSSFGQQDYASMSNGSSWKMRVSPSTNKHDKKSNARSPVKVLPKRACVSVTSSSSQASSPEKKAKLPSKVLPKRSAQRLPMSLIAADGGSSEDEDDMSDTGSAGDDGRVDGDVDGCEARFKCHLCDYKFVVRFQLTKHLSTHLELSPDMYSATADAKVIQLSERRRHEFYCDKCSVKFEKMSDLDIHMRKHGSRPYVCPFCQMPSTFKFAKQYLSHLYEHRFNYKCTMEANCDFTINRKDALKLHIFRMHLNQQLPAYIENYANMSELLSE